MCNKLQETVLLPGESQNTEKSFFDFLFWWKTKLPTDQKYLLWKGRVKPEVARLQTRWRSSWSEGVFSTSSPGSPRFPEDPGDEVGSVPCLRRAVSRGNRELKIETFSGRRQLQNVPVPRGQLRSVHAKKHAGCSWVHIFLFGILLIKGAVLLSSLRS